MLTELALLSAVLQPGVSRVAVDSATSCPTAAEVETRLEALLPSVPEGAPREHATITVADGALRVHLTGADGAAIGVRTLTLDVSCADRANVVAVVIAAWEAQQRNELLPAPAFPRAAPAVTTAASQPAPPRAPTPESPWTGEITAGPAMIYASGNFAPTAVAAATVWRRRLGGRLALMGVWPRDQSLGPGQAQWTRAGATAELAYRIPGRAGRLDLHGGVVAGAVIARGQGFDSDHTTSGFSPGLAGGVDWSWSLGRVVLGLGAGLWGWTDQRLVSFSTNPATRSLPRLELSLGASVGLAF
ncbi:MAG TPA: hypothetical protein VFH73_11115 [Polyangia bacterium]|nr:hypothetical protein [Polyangia bacterium]